MVLIITLIFLFGAASAAPKLRVVPAQTSPQLLTLPSNATSLRTDISDSFSCEGRDYGYYADVENDCQLFHVCLPMRYSDGRSQTFRWSFICPEETIFNQEIFTCTRSDESIDCAESPRYYGLNTNFGSGEEMAVVAGGATDIEDSTSVPAEVPQVLTRRLPHKN